MIPAVSKNHGVLQQPYQDLLRTGAHDDLRDTFTRASRGLLTPYAYLGEGAEYFKKFSIEHPAYYPYRAEKDLLIAESETIARHLKDTSRLIAVGIGDGEKEKILLSRMDLSALQEVLIVDVSSEFCTQGQKQLIDFFKNNNQPHIKVSSIPTGLDHAIPLIRKKDNTALTCFGGGFCNVPDEPRKNFPEDQMLLILTRFRELSYGKNGRVIVGYDSCQDPYKISDCYNNPDITKFILNAAGQAFELAQVNDIRADNISQFFDRHTRTGPGIVPQHNIVAKKNMRIEFNSTSVDIRTDDEFTAIYSVKPSIDQVRSLSRRAGIMKELAISSNDSTIHVLKIG